MYAFSQSRNASSYLRLLRGAQCEEHGEVVREIPPEGLPEGEEEVRARPDEPGVLATAGDPVERGRRGLEVALLFHRQGVD